MKTALSYRQYTQCVQPSSFQSSPIADAIAFGLFAALMEISVYILATAGFGLIAGGIAFLLAIVTGLLVWVHWWLYGRLICLGGERCAIGMVVSVEPPQEKSGFERLDSDYSFNLLLPPHLIGDNQATIESDGFLGELIREQPGIAARGLSFTGETARSCDSDPATAVLHCEFEGAGMHIFYQWLQGLLAILSVAAVASWFCAVPVIGWIACAVAAVLGAIALVGIFVALGVAMSDAASPTDVNPELGSSLHTNGCAGRGADLLVVSGEWVYDSLHSGWNEIHPVRHSQKVMPDTWEGSWPFDAHDAVSRWCDAIGAASSPLTKENQKKPENQWNIHPAIDGCETGETQPPIK